MLHPQRLTASENTASRSPETDWEARAEAAARRAEIAHFVSGGMLLGSQLDYLAVLDDDDPRILSADLPPVMPRLRRALCALTKRTLTALLRRSPIDHPRIGSESDDRQAAGIGADLLRGIHA